MPAPEIIPAQGERPEVEVVRSARRTRTVQAQPLPDGRVRLLVPAASTAADLKEYLDKLLPKIQAKQQAKEAKRRRSSSDTFLAERAQALREAYLPEAPAPASIRWVSNQHKQWGSATPADLSIRISDTLQGAPVYVLDAVIFHELCHLVQPNHSSAFRALEARYPRLDTARAFLEGITFGSNRG